MLNIFSGYFPGLKFRWSAKLSKNVRLKRNVRHFFLKKKIMHIFCHQNALKARYEQSIDNIQTNCNYKYHLCMDRILKEIRHILCHLNARKTRYMNSILVIFRLIVIIHIIWVATVHVLASLKEYVIFL